VLGEVGHCAAYRHATTVGAVAPGDELEQRNPSRTAGRDETGTAGVEDE
jgi:hypothetical protein